MPRSASVRTIVRLCMRIAGGSTKFVLPELFRDFCSPLTPDGSRYRQHSFFPLCLVPGPTISAVKALQHTNKSRRCLRLTATAETKVATKIRRKKKKRLRRDVYIQGCRSSSQGATLRNNKDEQKRRGKKSTNTNAAAQSTNIQAKMNRKSELNIKTTKKKEKRNSTCIVCCSSAKYLTTHNTPF